MFIRAFVFRAGRHKLEPKTEPGRFLSGWMGIPQVADLLSFFFASGAGDIARATPARQSPAACERSSQNRCSFPQEKGGFFWVGCIFGLNKPV